jgi:glutamate/tyrosine decarboxylase-like PLP-dependent enzyme
MSRFDDAPPQASRESISVLLHDAEQRAVKYLETISERRVFPLQEQLKELEKLGGPLPELPENPADVLALLDQVGSPATVAIAGGRYFGFVSGGALPATVAANWLAAAWDQNACLRVLSPVAAQLEDITLGWLLELFGLPPGCAGAFVTGAQTATFTALAAARHAVLARCGWDAEARGLFGAPSIDVVVGDEVHATVLKALAMLGLGRERVKKVPCDRQGRMRADSIPRCEGPTIICTQAGNVNTGSFDPVQEIRELTRGGNVWVHVDGAFGLWAKVPPEFRDLTKGVEAADSWGVDAHKWLNVPHDSGIAIVREPSHLHAAMMISAPYLAQGQAREPMQWTPESTRRARAIEIWTALRTLGRSGVAELVRRCCRHAVAFADGLRAVGFEILNEVELNQVLVAFGDDAMTARVIEAIQRDGTCWCGGTTWHGRKAMRISVSSWATTANDVERSLAAMVRIAGEASKAKER